MASTTLVVRSWHDEDLDEDGFSPRSLYVETVWLPVIGPSATWALRRLSLLAATDPQGCPVDLEVLATDLGLGSPARVERTLDRLIRFGLAFRVNGEIWIRSSIPRISERHVRRLSAGVQDVHRTMTSPAAPDGKPGAVRRRQSVK